MARPKRFELLVVTRGTPPADITRPKKNPRRFPAGGSLASGDDQEAITARSYAGCAGRPTRCPGRRCGFVGSMTLLVATMPPAAEAAPVRPPWNAVSTFVYITSRPISRFVTGFQIVREPTCQACQSAQPAPKPRGAQIRVSTEVLDASYFRVRSPDRGTQRVGPVMLEASLHVPGLRQFKLTETPRGPK